MLFVAAIGLLFLAGLVLFVVDRAQTEDAIRRNYPVIGRFRHLFSELGEFFRQYFFAMDREELPFNRAQRAWVNRAAEGKGNTVAFGSTRNLSVVGTPIFVNAAFPPLDDDHASSEPMLIGPGARTPGPRPPPAPARFSSLSPAVRALGAKLRHRRARSQDQLQHPSLAGACVRAHVCRPRRMGWGVLGQTH